MRSELSNEPVVWELTVNLKDGASQDIDIDVFEAADLLQAASKKTQREQQAEGNRPYLVAVRDDILIGHYKIEDASYTLANTFSSIITKMCEAEEKKITTLVESLVGTESTPANGQSQNDESGSPTDSESKPSSKSSAEKSPTTGKA